MKTIQIQEWKNSTLKNPKFTISCFVDGKRKARIKIRGSYEETVRLLKVLISKSYKIIEFTAKVKDPVIEAIEISASSQKRNFMDFINQELV